MATYPLDVAPPLLRTPEGKIASEDDLRQHPERFFQGSDIVWVTVAACLVLQMIPAISMFYSGAADRSSTFTLLRMPIITAAFCTVQWYLWGYSLTFSRSQAESGASWQIYSSQVQDLVLYRALVRPVGAAGPKIPELLYAFYQGMLACFTPALICGGVIKKFRTGRFLVFILLWSLFVYYPVARWTWSLAGLFDHHRVMDFAGGTAVHITSGTAVGAVVLFDAVERHGWGIFAHAWALDAPHSLTNLVLGMMLLWIGWFGFNGGSALGGNLRAVSACISTHIAASSGACAMLLLNWTLERVAKAWPKILRVADRRGAKVSVVHFCDGAVVGLVAITPAAGYVPVWSAGCIGAISSALIFFLKSTVLQDLMRSDPLYVFLIHTGGGFIGMVLTGCFARQYVVGFDGYSSIPDRSVAERVGWQLADALLGFVWSLAVTTAILLLLKVVTSAFTRKWTRLFDIEVDAKLQAELEYKERIE
ncbi:Rh-like protein/ammonium transporter [Parathielavia hyrcaniae]|uniref:Rh-like protein/ammonium transporter n=1 Tax=Parathielavia hyrcaniae TaxID=113614 RepID=A0AAN6Q3K2_9PEZI|nr:Rh-like protein/ammonium transporter [Parathielavia hyrcaniae]